MGKFTDNLINRTLDIFFSKDKTKLYLLLVFLLGFALRLVNVLNSPTSIDASGHAIMAKGFISSGKLGTWNQSVGLWHFLTDLSYKMFGVGDFGARFMVLVFGSLSIILIFLFTQEFFDKQVSLIAAFLLAVSPFHIAETVPEMDVMVMFFILLSMLFFVRALKEDRKFLFLASGAFIGAGILIKIYALLFVPSLLLYSVYYNRKYKSDKKKRAKNVFLFLIVAFVFCLVPLTYNYLLYKDKGFLDYIFTDTLGIGKDKSDQYYSWVSPYYHDYKQFFFGGASKYNSVAIPLFVYNLSPLINADILVFLLGILGLVLAFKKEHRDYLFLFLLVFLTIYTYLGSMVLMSKHFIFELVMFAPLSALVLSKIGKKINLKMLLVVILIFQLFWLYHYSEGNFYEKSTMNQLVSYTSRNIPQQSLVVFDSRIFRGIGTYIFLDKHYIESSTFPQLIEIQEQLPQDYQMIDTYFIECVDDDCGWGTIKNQPDFNKSTEQIVDFFRNNSALVSTISSTNKKSLSFSYKIYKTPLRLKQSVFQVADSTHTFWANPIGYDERISPVFDNYSTHTALNRLLDKLAHYIFFLSVLLSIFSIFIPFYLLINKNETQHNNTSI